MIESAHKKRESRRRMSLIPFALYGTGDGNRTRNRLIKDKIVNYGKNISLNRVDADMFKTLASVNR
jgi:hypothetical protein